MATAEMTGTVTLRLSMKEATELRALMYVLEFDGDRRWTCAGDAEPAVFISGGDDCYIDTVIHQALLEAGVS